MKRPLVCAAVGFVLGEVWLLAPVEWKIGTLAACAAGVLWMTGFWGRTIPMGNGSSLVSGQLPFFACRSECGRAFRREWLSRLLCLLAFALIGAGMLRGDQRRQAEAEQVLDAVSGKVVQAEGTVRAMEETSGGLLSLELSRTRLRVEGEEHDFGDVLAYLDMEEPEIRVGMRVIVWGELEAFSPASNPGMFDFQKYYHSLGFSGRLFGKKLQMADGSYSPYLDGIRSVRQQAAQILQKVCTEKDRGLFQAVTLGDKSALAGEVRDLYQDNGIAHLLAVSGLHISLIGLGFYHLLRRLGISLSASGALAAALTVSYGILTGGSASVVRAVLMVCFQFAADRLGRTYDSLSALSAAALFLLVDSPTLLFQAGFQLSFGAVLAISGLSPILQKVMGGGADGKMLLQSGLSVSLSIHVVTFPVIVYHFFTFPLYSAVLNLLVIPLMGYVLISGIAGILTGFSQRFLGSMTWMLSEFFIGTGHYILALYEWLCLQFQKLPGALVTMGRPRLWQIAVYSVMWLGILWWMRGGDRKANWPALTVGVMLGFLILRPLPVKGLSVTFLDVGQGDGICMQTRDAVILVDGGSTDQKNLGEQVLEPFLLSRGISQVDYAIVSHGDQDHISGLTWMFSENSHIRIRHLVLPCLGQGDEAYDKLISLAQEAGTQVHWMGEGDAISAGELGIQCLYAGRKRDRRERNEHSLLLKVSYGKAGILLTGDMSETGEKAWLAGKGKALGEIQILKVAHHGSESSTSRQFLEAVVPCWAVISCGADNSYGHPSPETTARLDACGIPYSCTMESGAVMVETDGETMEIWGFLDGE